MENTLNSQEQIQKNKEELVLDELYSYCSTSKAPLIVKLFKIRGIFNKLNEIKYPSYFLYMLNEKSAAEEKKPEELYLNSYPYNGEWNYTGLVGYEYLVGSYGLMYRLTRHSFSVWCKSTVDKIGSYWTHLSFASKLFLFIPLGLLCCLLLIAYPLAKLIAYLKAKIIYTVIKSKVKSKSFRDKNSYELELYGRFCQLVDDSINSETNSINNEIKRNRIKSLYNEIMLERARKGRSDDKLFGELLSNEAYQKNLLCIMELICEGSNDDFNTLRDILSKKTTDSLLELCRSFNSGVNTESLKINIDKMMLMHENANEVILSSISNTCKVGDVFSENTANVDIDHYISLFDSKWEHINQCTELIKYFQQKKLEADGTGRKIERICRGISPNEHFWSKVRDRFGLNVFNMCIRGKGSGDTSRIDTDPANNLLARLNDGLENNDNKLKIYTSYEGTYFLFDQVTKSKDGDYETSNYRNSVLADRGKRITEKVLNLFLPPNYKLENQDEKLVVRKTEQSKYEIIANKIDEINKLFDKYQDQETECKKRAKKYKQKNDTNNAGIMRQKAEEYERAKNEIFSELEGRLNEWQLEFCPNGYSDLPDSESDFRKKLELDTDSYRRVRECFQKTFKLSISDIDKNIFDDMLATILYRYIATIHQASDIYPDAAARNTFMNGLRKEFGGECSNDKLDSCALGTITGRATKYFKYLDEVETVRQGVSNASRYKLPGKFCEYNENDADCMCTALNYIQVLIQSAIAVMGIDTADEGIKIRFNRNVNKLVRMFENETQEADGDYQDLKTKIEKIVLNNPDAKKQEIFVKLLLDGVIDYSENQIQEICDMAQKFTDFDLDNPTREHVTQINCVRAEKDAQGNLVGCKFDTKGVLSVEVPDDFQPPQDLQEDLHAQDDVRIVDTGVVLNLFRDMLMNLGRAGLNIPRMAQIINNHLRNDD